MFERPIKHVRYAAIWHDGNPGFEMIIERSGDDERVWNQEMFKALEQHRSEIDDDLVESEEDKEVVWQLVEKNGSRVAIYRNGNVYQDTEFWGEFRELDDPKVSQVPRSLYATPAKTGSRGAADH